MKRKHKLTLVVGIMAACIMILTVDRVHQARWRAKWTGLGDRAVEIQAQIDQLVAEGAPEERIDGQRTRLSDTLKRMSATFNPRLIPVWLHGIAVVGTWAGAIALWKLLRNQCGTRQRE